MFGTTIGAEGRSRFTEEGFRLIRNGLVARPILT
jgi:hypothetical protein